MKPEESPHPVIWDRPEPDERRAPTPLARAQVVAAAVRLADAEGLAAVSIRNVAASVAVRPMRLYRHVTGKDELLQLMIDAVYAEIGRQAGIGNVGGVMQAPDAPWRSQVNALAHATRDVVRSHPWAVDLLGGRPQLGPHTLDVGQATAAALARAPGRDDPRALRVALGTLNSYLLGALRREIGEQRAGESSGLTTAQWQVALGPYLSRQLATGRLPMIESIVRAPDPDADATFDSELTLILDALDRLPGT
jgi:AcrR family transcriptional regulator